MALWALHGRAQKDVRHAGGRRFLNSANKLVFPRSSRICMYYLVIGASLLLPYCLHYPYFQSPPPNMRRSLAFSIHTARTRGHWHRSMSGSAPWSADDVDIEAVGDGGIDLDRYPIHRLGSCPDAAQIVDRARASLHDTGCATFPNFMRPAMLKVAASEAVCLAPHAFVTDDEHNAYQLPPDDSGLFGKTHVRNLPMRTRVASNAFDELGAESALRALYMWPGLTRFIAAVTGAPCYRLADALGCCSVNVFRSGWEHAWHFDEAETTVTLCLQPATEGGTFEYTPQLRSSQEDLAEGPVSSIIRAHSRYDPEFAHDPDTGIDTDADADAAARVSVASFGAGTLQIFHGRYCLHRVTQIRGDLDRLVAVLCFAGEPGVYNSPEVQRMFWGREAPTPLPHV